MTPDIPADAAQAAPVLGEVVVTIPRAALVDAVYEFLISEGYHGHYPTAEEQAEKFVASLARLGQQDDQQAADIARRIEAWIRHGEAVPADVTTYERWIVHEELRAILAAAREPRSES